MKRYFAPFTIIVLMIAFVLFIAFIYVTVLDQANLPFVFKLIILGVGLIIIAALVYTLIHRIHEIKKEDPEDFTKY